MFFGGGLKGRVGGDVGRERQMCGEVGWRVVVGGWH